MCGSCASSSLWKGKLCLPACDAPLEFHVLVLYQISMKDFTCSVSISQFVISLVVIALL